MTLFNKIFFILLTSFTFIGCLNLTSTVTVSDDGLVEKYNKMAPEVKDNETLLYVIKSDTFVRSDVPNIIEVNGELQPLDNGEYLEYRLTEQINTLAFFQGSSGVFGSSILSTEGSYPFKYIALDNPRGDTIFYYLEHVIDSSVPIVKKIDNNFGKTLIMHTNYQRSSQKKKPTKGDGYEIALLNPSLIYFSDYENWPKNKFHQNFENKVNAYFQKLKTEQQTRENLRKNDSFNFNKTNNSDDFDISTDKSLLKEANREIRGNMSKKDLSQLTLSGTLMKLDPTPSKKVNNKTSRVIIYREADNGSPLVGIWTKNEYLGSLMGETYIELITMKSDFTFYTRNGKWQTLNLRLKNGVVYYIRVDYERGWEKNYTSLHLSTEKDFKYNQGIKKIILDEDKINKNYKERLRLALKILADKK